jgi:hypothetical protein
MIASMNPLQGSSAAGGISSGFRTLLEAQSRRDSQQATARAEALEAQAARERRLADQSTRRSKDLDDQAETMRDEAQRLGAAQALGENAAKAFDRATQTVARLVPYDAGGQPAAEATTGSQISVTA